MPPIQKNVRRRRILIVDPDSKAARDLWELFIDENIDVEITGGITKAAERIKDVKYDCVIMDVDLPEMKGYTAVSILKAIDPELQIIMTTSENTKELEANVRKQDIFYYYIKSFDSKELKEAVWDVFKKTGKFRKEVNMVDKSAKILVVDDDPGFVTAIMPVLESKGYEVEAAYDSEDAIGKIEKLKPDLILLDIMMENLTSGFDLCYKLKHNPETKNTPVLVISAVTEKTGLKFSPATDGEYFEADDYVEKPVKPSDLLERVERLLKG